MSLKRIYKLINELEKELKNIFNDYNDVSFAEEKLRSFEFSINGLEKNK